MSWRRVAAGVLLACAALAGQWAGTASAERVQVTGSAGDLEISLSTDKTRYDPDDTAHFLIRLTKSGRPASKHEVRFGAISDEDIYSAPGSVSPKSYTLTDRRGELRFSLRFTAGSAEYTVYAGADTGEPAESARASLRVDARRPFYLRRPFVAGVVLALIAGAVARVVVRRRRARSR